MVLDGLLAAVVMTLAMAATRRTGGPQAPVWADVLVLLAAVGGAVLRRVRPVPALAVVVFAAVATTGSGTFPTAWLVVAAVMYTVASVLPERSALRLLAATLALDVAGSLAFLALPYAPSGSNRAGTVIVGALLAGVGWTLGYAARQQRRYADGARERAEQRARAEVAEARRAISEERLRIARELHDVVAHTMGVIAVQAGVANHVAAHRPDEAGRALASIEETSRGALREMRTLLGVLRGEEPPPPTPGLGDLDAVIQRAATAGVHVEVTVTGDPAAAVDLPAGLELAAYRVVQEAVTNVIKHAGADRCRVTVGYLPEALTVDIDDDGRGGAPAAGGHGLDGMRERVAAYGGTLHVWSPAGRGFHVSARFPR